MSAYVSAKPKKRIVVVAKYDLYKVALESKLQGNDIEVAYYKSFNALLEEEGALVGVDYYFFPHSPDIIPNEFLIEHACIGFHTGDLPNDRGGSPIQHKILKGEYFTKISALKLSDKLDSGDIYMQKDLDLSQGTIEELIGKISEIVADMILLLLKENLEPTPQLLSGTISKRLTEEDSVLDFQILGTREIFDRIRMLDGLDYPRARTTMGKHEMYLTEAELSDQELKFVCTIRLGDDYD